MSAITLVIGNKAYSSWSLRPWLALKRIGVPFAEVLVPLRQPDSRANILKHSPSGKVPLLKHGETVVWESLAICEYLAETYPDADVADAYRISMAVTELKVKAGRIVKGHKIGLTSKAMRSLTECDSWDEALKAELRLQVFQ